LKGTARRTIVELSDREQRMQRKKWKSWQRESRDRKRAAYERLSPPPTPPEVIPIAEPEPGPSAARIAGKRRRDRARSQSMRRNRSLEGECESVKCKLDMKVRAINRYRVQLHRLIKKGERETPLTPRKKVKKLLKKSRVDQRVTQELVRHRAIVDEVLRNIRKRREGKAIRDSISQKIIRKYGLKKWFRGEGVWLSNKKRKTIGRPAVSDAVRNKVASFFIRDDVSTMTAGKKSTITRQKQKQQRRLLQNSILEVYKRYLRECEPEESVSYTTFCRLKPFWVVQPKLACDLRMYQMFQSR